MYVINIEELDQSKIYFCNNVIAEWLIYQKRFPLLGKSKDGKFCFSKTELLDEVLEKLPFYLRVTKSLW